MAGNSIGNGLVGTGIMVGSTTVGMFWSEHPGIITRYITTLSFICRYIVNKRKINDISATSGIFGTHLHNHNHRQLVFIAAPGYHWLASD